jgi:hypothetical protein
MMVNDRPFGKADDISFITSSGNDRPDPTRKFLMKNKNQQRR